MNNTIKRWRKEHPWISIRADAKNRCTNKNYCGYHRYGGRGIKCLITTKEVKRLWFRDKAWLLEKPSIDRKDNNENYTFENCRFIEMPINAGKDKEKPVNQYDLQGNFIRSWKSMHEVERKLGFANQNISKVCLGKRKTANGYIWKHVKGENE